MYSHVSILLLYENLSIPRIPQLRIFKFGKGGLQKTVKTVYARMEFDTKPFRAYGDGFKNYL